jgi:hypothetical protein
MRKFVQCGKYFRSHAVPPYTSFTVYIYKPLISHVFYIPCPSQSPSLELFFYLLALLRIMERGWQDLSVRDSTLLTIGRRFKRSPCFLYVSVPVPPPQIFFLFNGSVSYQRKVFFRFPNLFAICRDTFRYIQQIVCWEARAGRRVLCSNPP